MAALGDPLSDDLHRTELPTHAATPLDTSDLVDAHYAANIEFRSSKRGAETRSN